MSRSTAKCLLQSRCRFYCGAQKGVEPMTYTSRGLVHKACPVPALLVAGAATPIFLSSRSASLFDFIRNLGNHFLLLSSSFSDGRPDRYPLTSLLCPRVFRPAQLSKFPTCSEH